MVEQSLLSRAAAILNSAQSIFIAAHVKPDGDTVGSQLAVGNVLVAAGKRVTLSLDDKIPESLNFLKGVKDIASREPGAEEVFVYLDGSDSKRYGKALNREKSGTRPVILIDHHTTNEPFGDLNLVDTTAASTAEIVFDLLRTMGAPITAVTSQGLLAGIVTDTLGFRTDATTPETLEKAAELVRAGGSIPQIVEQVYNRRSYGALRALSHAIERSRLEGRVIWSALDYRTLKGLGLNDNGTSGIVNQLLTAADASIAFLLVEKQDGKVDLSLRARPGTDISGIAAYFKGGGHKLAAGALLPPPLATAPQRVLDVIHQEIPRSR